MTTEILKEAQLKEAVDFLKKGEIVAIPTETVYGLAADATNDEALRKIFTAKGRPSDHPLIVHIDSVDKVHQWAEFVSEDAKKLAKQFWPGPLTMIFRKRKTVSTFITGGLDTVAVRVPNHPVALEIIKKLGNGIAAPSANSHKKTSPTKSAHVLSTLDGKIAAVIDGGSCSIGIESTIIDMTKKIPVILRPGVITTSMIETVLNMKIDQPMSHNEKVSGNMHIHYQPKKPLFILSKKEIDQQIQKEQHIAIIHQSTMPPHQNAEFYPMPTKKADYAKKIYEIMHHIDQTNVDKIWVETPPSSNEWADINDRLLKASSK